MNQTNVVLFAQKDPAARFEMMGRDAATDCYLPALRCHMAEAWVDGSRFVSMVFECDPDDPLFMNSQHPHYAMGVKAVLQEKLKVRVIIQQPTAALPVFRLGICRSGFMAWQLRVLYWLGRRYAVFR